MVWVWMFGWIFLDETETCREERQYNIMPMKGLRQANERGERKPFFLVLQNCISFSSSSPLASLSLWMDGWIKMFLSEKRISFPNMYIPFAFTAHAPTWGFMRSLLLSCTIPHRFLIKLLRFLFAEKQEISHYIIALILPGGSDSHILIHVMSNCYMKLTKLFKKYFLAFLSLSRLTD